MEQALAPGRTVRFAAPLNDREAAQRFAVIELRGPRVLVQTLDPYLQSQRLVPQMVYALADLTLAD